MFIIVVSVISYCYFWNNLIVCKQLLGIKGDAKPNFKDFLKWEMCEKKKKVQWKVKRKKIREK